MYLEKKAETNMEASRISGGDDEMKNVADTFKPVREDLFPIIIADHRPPLHFPPRDPSI